MKRDQLSVIQGDITKQKVDAIVNAANSSLMGGGGVDGAIHRAGGPEILAACKQIVMEKGRCPTGQAVITTAGRLPARFVIHTVGPVWHGGDGEEERLLASCYEHSLELADANGCKSIAFPNISTGIYGFPKALAAKIAVAAVRDFSTVAHLKQVIFVCFENDNFDLMRFEIRLTG